MEDKKTKRSDKRRKTSTENGKRFTKFGRNKHPHSGYNYLYCIQNKRL